jgi:hypothetical protein
MGDFNLGTINIFELGQIISSKLGEYGVSNKSELNIYLNKEEFKKVDEDLFYRIRRDDKEDFVPSDGEININFENVKIIIKEGNYECN